MSEYVKALRALADAIEARQAQQTIINAMPESQIAKAEENLFSKEFEAEAVLFPLIWPHMKIDVSEACEGEEWAEELVELGHTLFEDCE